MPKYDGSIRINTEIDAKNVNSQMMKVMNSIEKNEAEVDRLRAKLKSLGETKTPTEEYKRLSKEIETAYADLDRLAAKQKELKDMGFSAIPESLLSELDKAGEKVGNLEIQMDELVKSGSAFTLGSDTDEYAKMSERVRYLTGNIEASKQKLVELNQKQKPITEEFSRVQKAAAGLGKIFGNAGKMAGKAFNSMRNAAKKLFSSITSGTKQSNGLLSTFASRLKGMALSLLIFNWISKGFNAMVSGMKTGFTNLMNYSSEYANSIQSLKNAMSTLGNSFAAAFAPIVQAAIPYLVQLINWVNNAVNAVAQLIAALSGKSTWTKATKVQAGYNDELKDTASSAKKAYGALAKFDDLDVLQKQEEAGTSGGTAGGDVGDGFEEVPIDSKWKDLAAWLREMWENADFYELGQLIGEKLKEALDNIPWDEIKEKARKLGKSLATLINGFVEVEGLGYSIGNTLAQAFNTAFEFLNSFVHNLHWASIGSFIADTLNGIFQNIDWALIKDTFVTGAKGLADAINSFTDTFDWDSISTTIANALNTLSETILTFFDTVDLHEVGTKVGQQITQTLEKIDWSGAGDALGTMVHSLLDAINAALDELDWVVIGESIRDFFLGIDWLTLLQDVGDLIAEILNGILIASFTALGGDGDALQKQWEEGKKVREQEREDFRTWASDMETEAGTFVDDMKEKLSDPSMWDISIALQTLGETWQGIAEEYIVPIVDNIKLAWEELKTWLSDTWTSIMENASEIWESVKQFFVDTWTLIQEKALEIWEHLRTTFDQKMDAIKDKTQKISDKFNEFKTTVSTVFTSVKESIVGAIEKIIGKISDFISKIQEAIQAVKDFLSSGFEKISGFFGGIFGGSGSSGISATAYSANAASYSLDDVPALASGAVIRGGNPFLAVLGDQPSGQTNIEAPLSTIEQAVENVLSRSGYGLGGSARITLQLNGQDVGEALIDDLMSVMNRRGMNVDILGVT